MTILKSNFLIGGRVASSVNAAGAQSNLTIKTTRITSSLSLLGGVHQSSLAFMGARIYSNPLLGATEAEANSAASAREQAAIARTAANDAHGHADAARAALSAVKPLADAAAESADAAAAAKAGADAARDTAAEHAAGIALRARDAAAAATAAAAVEANVREAAGLVADSAAAAAHAAAAAAEHKGAALAASDAAAGQAENATRSASAAERAAQGIEAAQAASEEARDAAATSAGAAAASKGEVLAARDAAAGAAAAAAASEATAMAAHAAADAAQAGAEAAQRAAKSSRDESVAYSQAAALSAAGAAESEGDARSARDDARKDRAGSDAARLAAEAARDEASKQARAAATSAAGAGAEKDAAQAASGEAAGQASAAAQAAAAAAASEAAALATRDAAATSAGGARAARDAAAAHATVADTAAAQARSSEAAALAARQGAVDAAAAAHGSAMAAEARAIASIGARDDAYTARANAEHWAGVAGRAADASAAAAGTVAYVHESAAAAKASETAAAQSHAEAQAQARAAATSAAHAADSAETAEAARMASAASAVAADAARAAATASEAVAVEAIRGVDAKAAAAAMSAQAAAAGAADAAAGAADAAAGAANAAERLVEVRASASAASAARTAAEGAADIATAAAAAAHGDAGVATVAAASADASADAASADAAKASASATASAGARDAALTHAESAAAAADRAAANNTVSQPLSGRDADGGYAGLTRFKLNLKNALGTVISFLTNANTAERTYTLPDRDMTFAGKDDIDTLTAAVGTKLNASARDANNGVAGLDTSYRLRLRSASGAVASFLTNSNSAARTYTMPNKSGTVALLDDLAGLTSGTNTGDETAETILSKLSGAGVTALSGSNTGDETTDSLKLKLQPVLSGVNTGDQTLESLGGYPASNPAGYTSNAGTVTSVTATAPLVSSGGDAPKISLPKATGTVDGYLSKTDFSSFAAKQDALGFTPINAAVIGAAGGVVPLGMDSKIAAIYLPSYVDDVLEYDSLAAFPAVGERGKLYIAINAGTSADPTRQYRWSGTVYAEINASPGSTDAVPEGAGNKYFTAARVLSVVLAGFSTATNAVATAADTVLVAIGKLQAQVTARAMKGANSDITALSGLTTALTVAQGGTGVKTLTGLAYGNGTGAFSAATAAQVATALGTQGIAGNAASASAAPWGGITGKPDIVAMVPGTIITNQDWNTLTTPGVYQVAECTGANKPFTYPWGTLIVTNVNGVITQEYISHQAEQSSRIYYGSWWHWRAVLDHLNYKAYRAPTLVEANFSDWKRGFLDKPDFNWLHAPGMYRYNGDAVGGTGPGTWAYGNLLVIQGTNSDTVGQIYVDHASGGIASRGVITSNGAASPWRFAPGNDGWNAFGTWGINITGTSGNTSSVSGALNTSNRWNGEQAFNTNRRGAGVTTGGGVAGGMFVTNGGYGNGPACMTFLMDGDWGVNFGLDSDRYMRIGGWNCGNMFGFGTQNGDFSAAGNISAFSDERLKQNWRALGDDFVELMAGVKAGIYDRKDTGLSQAGVSAQDVRAILPYCVSEEDDEMRTLILAYGNFAGVGVVKLAQRSMQHDGRIRRLTKRAVVHGARIKALEGEVAELKELVRQLVSKG